MSLTINKRNREKLIRFLLRKIPKLEEIAFDLGFFSVEELVETALQSSQSKSILEAEAEVLSFILKSLGYEPDDSVTKMESKLKMIISTYEKISTWLQKFKLRENISKAL